MMFILRFLYQTFILTPIYCILIMSIFANNMAVVVVVDVVIVILII